MPELERLFPSPAAAGLTAAPGPAQRALLEIGALVRERKRAGTIDSLEQKNMEEDVTALIDALGVCERIQRTPIPVGYALHLRRFMTLYCLTLTLALVDPLGWYSPLVIGFVSYAFFGIEQMGIEIQDPFGCTPNGLDLDRIAQTIETDTTSLLEK